MQPATAHDLANRAQIGRVFEWVSPEHDEVRHGALDQSTEVLAASHGPGRIASRRQQHGFGAHSGRVHGLDLVEHRRAVKRERVARVSAEHDRNPSFVHCTQVRGHALLS